MEFSFYNAECRMQNYEYFLQKAEQMLCLLCYAEMVGNHIQL